MSTLDTDDSRADAILIEKGIVTALGTTAEVLARVEASADIPVVDLLGATVLPGLIDSHTHVEFCALSRDWLDVRGLPPEQTLHRLRESIEGTEHDWLVAQGTFGQDLPGRAELDSVSTTTPILVRESMHRLSANSAALMRAGIVRGYTSPRGTLVELDDDGEPTGRVDEGYHLFPVPSPGPERLEAMLEHELRESFARHGVTTIFELPATAAGVRAYQRLNASGRLPTRLGLTLTVAPGLNAILASVDQLAGIGLGSGFGDDRLWLNGVKLFLDGDHSSSYDSEHLSLSPSRWGTVTRHYADLVRELVVADGARLQVWIHAIGDLAQSVALDAIEEARRATGRRDRRTRLEHVGNLWVDEALIERLRDLEVIPVPTAGFIHASDEKGVYAFRSLIEAGLTPPGNSDTGGTQPFATNPWFGVAAMLDRKNQQGIVVNASEAVDVHTAVRTYSEFAAYAGGLEGRIGVLRIGSRGDCAVYRDDPRGASPDELRDLEADLTIVDGRIVWRRGARDD
ncbi:amidohydrolase [Streptomyces cuspidosporus]|uniref:Amidohydrolase n=1 Tax=Streptomyces cuspidosporus TaxID=66882 RepID=A0ABN3FBW4_9ACTN